MCAMMLGLGSSGCAALMDAAAFDPRALALLPVAAAAQVLGAAAKENRKPSNGMINVLPASAQAHPLAYRHWDDPDDWIAECDGPILCGEHEHFSCTGTPGDCFCDCVGNFHPPSPPPVVTPNALVRAH